MSEIAYPDLWRIVRIVDVCHPIERVDPKNQKDGSFRYIDISSIDNEQKIITKADEIPNSEAPSRARQLVTTNDVLVSTVRPNLNAVAIVPNQLDEAVCSTGFCVLRSNTDLINPNYLFSWARHPEFVQRLTRLARGISYPAVSDNDVYKLRIPLPPLPEQERIVAILREADDLRRQQQTAVATAQTLIPALFHHMFGDPATNPKGWPTIKLEKVCTRITDGTHQPPNFDDNGTVPFLFVSNIVSGKIDFNTEKFITPNTYEGLMRRCPVEVNDILYSTVGSYGVAVQVDTERPFAFQRHIAHIKPDHVQIDATYLTAMLNSAYVKAQADRRARGIAQKTVNLNEIGRFQILLPPKPLQEEFGEIINQEVKSIQLEQYGGNEKFESLVKSLLARAFDGELTERYRQSNFELLQAEAEKRDALLGHVRHLAAPVVAEPTGVAQVLNGRDSLARSLSQPQQSLLQTIVAYLQANGRRYFTLPGFLADHLDISPNAARQNVELLEKVGLLTRVGRQVEPEGIPYFETFYRLTTPLEHSNSQFERKLS